jgi:restriction endonuclease Mrr
MSYPLCEVSRRQFTTRNPSWKKAELLRSERRGYFSIAERGKDVLAQNPQSIDLNSLLSSQSLRLQSQFEGRIQTH